MSAGRRTRTVQVEEVVDLVACDMPGCPSQEDAPPSAASLSRYCPSGWGILVKIGERGYGGATRHLCQGCLASVELLLGISLAD
jgi:hypothetical protein